MRIAQHKIVGVPFVPTEKMGGTLVPKFVVMHYTAGYTTEGDVHTLAKSERPASAHVVVGRDGKVVQIVPFNRVAWHAGPSAYKGYTGLNNHSIGIEIANCGWLKKQSNGTYVDQYGNVINGDGLFANGKRRLASAPKDWHHEYHPRLARGEYAWEPYTEAQLKTLDTLMAELYGSYAIIGVLSHEEIDTRKWKTDPGPVFPMRRYEKPLDDRSANGTVWETKVNVATVRLGPDVSYPIANRTLSGVRMTEIGREGEWIHVEYGKDKQKGWVHGDHLRAVD